MKISHVISLILLMATTLTGCREQGQEEPHPAVLYNICEVVSASDNATVLHLYRPDSDDAVTLTASAAITNADGTRPEAGTCGLVGYIPDNGESYASGSITLTNWAAITGITVKIPDGTEETDPLAGWDRESIGLLSCWRAGTKLILRVLLPYSGEPRRFSLVADPATLNLPVPTLYLCHSRTEGSLTFDRQYYVAIDIAELWNDSSIDGITVMVNDNRSAHSPVALNFSK